MDNKDFESRLSAITRLQEEYVSFYIHETSDWAKGREMYTIDIPKVYSVHLPFKTRLGFAEIVKIKASGTSVNLIDKHGIDYTCEDFYHGAMSDIINILPEETERIRKQDEKDLLSLLKEGDFSIGTDYDGAEKIYLAGVEDGEISVCINGVGIRNINTLPDFEVTLLTNYIWKKKLHESEEYKKLIALLEKEDTKGFDFAEQMEYPEFTLSGTDIKCVIAYIVTTKSGIELTIRTDFDELPQDVILNERGLLPEYLSAAVKAIEKIRKPVSKLLNLTEEQKDVANEISKLVEKFKSLGGEIVVNACTCNMVALNAKEVGIATPIDTDAVGVYVDEMDDVKLVGDCYVMYDDDGGLYVTTE